MKTQIHPKYEKIKVTCSCGNEFTTNSTIGHDLHLEICSNCHPFYTGNQKLIDSAGRIDKFRKKYEAKAKAAPAPVTTEKTESKKAKASKETKKK